MGLLDQIRRVIGPRPPARPFAEQGVGGFRIYRGYLDPNETNYQLVGVQRWKTAADLLANVSIIAAGVRYSLNLISRPHWRFEPPNDTAPAKAAAEFMEEVIGDIDASWTRIIRRAGMYRYHGFGINEWVAKRRDDGKIGIGSIESRPQHTIERWDIDASGGVKGVWQRDPITAEELYLPRRKLLYIVDDSLTDSPDGIGWFRHLAEPAHALKSYLELESMGFERDLAGIPVGRAPLQKLNALVEGGKITPAQRDTMIAGLEQFVSLKRKDKNTSLILDSTTFKGKSETGESISSIFEWGVELLTGSQNSIDDLGNAIKRLQFDMAMIMGTESLLVGREGEGSRALSEDKSRNLYLTANATLADMAESVDRDLVTPIWEMNGLPEELKPRAKVEDVAFKDAEQIARALADMASAGAILDPNDPAINDLRDLLGIQHAPPMDVATLNALTGKPDPTKPSPDKELDDERAREAMDREDQRAEQERKAGNDNPGKPKPGEKKPAAKAGYDPNQPRDRGGPGGGRWTRAGGAESLLRSHADAWEQLGAPTSKERWLLEEGEQQGPPVELPEGVEQGKQKECYKNSVQALLHGKVSPAEWAYTEGVVTIPEWPVPIDHAWLSNQNGDVLELTLRDQEGVSYFGVPMDWEFVSTKTFENGYYGLFSDGGSPDLEIVGTSMADRRAWPKVGKAFNPDQPRDPGGEGGGQWISSGGGSAGEFKVPPIKPGWKGIREHPFVDSIDDGRAYGDPVFVYLKQGLEWSGQHSFSADNLKDAQQLLRSVTPEPAAKAYNPSQPRAPKGTGNGGQWISHGGTSAIEDGSERTLTVYRAGRSGSSTLEGKNAGDLEGVAAYLMDADDFEKPGYSNPLEEIQVYEVKHRGEPGPYQRLVSGKAHAHSPTTETPTIGEGRSNGWGKAYSFPTGAKFEERLIARIPVADVRAELKAATGYESFDMAGGAHSVTAIEAVRARLVEKFNPNQPRYPKGHPMGGKWRDEGGYREGERAEGELVEVAEVVRQYLSDEDIAELQAMVESEESTAEQILDKLKPLDETSKGLTPTLPEGTEPGMDFWGKREYVGGKSFTETLDALDEKAASYAGEGGVKQDREALILIGPPAAGKSSSAEAIATQMGAAIVDADDAKKMIPEYAGGIGAAAVHEESSLMSGYSRVRHMARGDNIIMPIVGGSPSSVTDKISQLESWGYKAKVMLVDVHPDVAARRMAGRTLRTGRHISSSYARTIGLGPRRTFDALKGTMPNIGFARIDANGPKGSEVYAEVQGISGLSTGSSVFRNR